MIGGMFINREAELARFKIELRSTTPHRNRIIFLAAPSGFGKSELTERVITEEHHRTLGIKIRLPANAGGDAPFVRALAAEINRLAEREGAIATGDEFLRGALSLRLRNLHDDALLRGAGAALKGDAGNVIVRMRDRIANIGEYDFERLQHDTSRDATVKLFEYARYTFAQHRFCAAIENIQILDDASESMFDQILAVQRGHFLLMEYTLDAPAARELEGLERLFRDRGSEVQSLILERLSLDEIVQRSQYRLDPETTSELYANFDGNLRKLKDLVLIRTKTPQFAGASLASDGGILEATRQLLASLRPTAQFVLALIVTHRSAASHEALLSLSARSKYFRETHVGVDDALQELLESELVTSERGRLKVAHDSIATEVAASFTKYTELANRTWADHYRRRLESSDFVECGKDQVLDFLFSFYVRSDPARLWPLLNTEVRHVALNSLSLQRAQDILQTIEVSLQENLPDAHYDQRLRWELLEIYYTAGLYARALATLLRVNTKPLRRTVFHAAILDRLDRHGDAIRLIDSTLSSRAVRHDSAELSLKLIKMVCHRSLNEYKACDRVYKEIENTPEYRKLPEFGYFLRNSEIVLPVLASVPVLEQSAHIFRSHGNAAAEAQARISLGMQLIRLGRLLDAEQQLDAAEDLLSDRRIEWHVIHNDRAVLNLYRETPDYDTIDELLVKAFLTANIPFDRIAIENNRLAVHAMTGDFDFCEGLSQELQRAAVEGADEVLLCITYYNISVYYDLSGNEVASTRFRDQARAYSNDWPEYWAHRFAGKPIMDDPAAEYLARYPFDLVLLSAWHIDISDFGERSESTPRA